MSWSNVIGLTIGFLVLLLVTARTEQGRQWVSVVFLVIPSLILIVVWATLFRQWTETGLAFGLAVAAGLIWWWRIGRRLAPVINPTRVWGQESAPKPRPAELQAEISQLKEERDQLAEELKRLRQNDGHRPEA